MNRRKDHQLRASINRLYGKCPDITDCASLLRIVLDEFINLSLSPFGFALEVDPVSRFHRSYEFQIIESLQNPPTYRRLRLQHELSFLRDAVRTNKPVILNPREIPTEIKEKLALPEITTQLVIPLLDNENLFGLICLCNSEAPYNTNIVQRCWPLLARASHIRRSIVSHGKLEKIPPSRNFEHTRLVETSDKDTIRNIEQLCPLGVIVINHNFEIIRSNKIAEDMLIMSKTQLLGRLVTSLIPERFPNEHQQYTFANRQPKQSHPQHSRFILTRNDGSILPVKLTAIPYSRVDGTHCLIMLQDLSELEQFKKDQAAQQDKFQTVSDMAPVGIMQTDLKWECVYVNESWSTICRMNEEELLGAGWINAIHQDDLGSTLMQLHQSINDGQEFRTECRLRTRLGEIVWVELRARPFYTRENSHMTGMIATLTDITYRVKIEHKLRSMAELDPLTSLANRTLFLDRLKQAIHELDRNGPLALLCMDLDGFKNVNDSLGHDAGDQLLIMVANRLQNILNYDDTIARIGGDEFTVLIENVTNVNAVSNTCEKILAALREPMIIDSHEVFISVSIGTSICMSKLDTEPKHLMKQADIALYRAKAEGRNNYQYYSPELEMISHERLTLSNSLHRALERDEFELHFQLQTNGIDGEVIGAEPLLRWNHPQRGLLKPVDFIPLLEETGLIVAVGCWIIERSFAIWREWQNKQLIAETAHISINLAARQLRDIRLVDTFERLMMTYDIRGSQVVIEITESVLLEQTLATQQILCKLKQHGIQIALDDFGTGYSSLTYLKRFPIDFIKIDRDFVKDILTDPEDSAITRGIIALAISLNLKTIAEGVDAQEKMETLQRWGCDYFQGYFINAPTPQEETEKLIESISKKHVIPGNFTKTH